MEINYQIKAELNCGTIAAPIWGDLGVTMKNLTQSLNEVIYQASYLADEGWGSTEVTGGQFTVTFTGDKKVGDTVSDFIFSDAVQMNWGEARKTQLRLTSSTAVITWNVTLANITDAGGDSTATNAVTLVIHGNGKPSITPVAASGSRLESLSIGTLLLNPSFTSSQFGYSATTSDATSVVTAVAEATGAAIVIKNGATTVTNGAAATWSTGTNVLVITVTNGGVAQTYTVVVTKTA